MSPTYLLKTGKQIRAIKAMIDRVTSGAVASSAPVSASPAAPSSVIALDRSDTAIDVGWSAVPGATSYDMAHAWPGDADTGLQAATQHRCKVRASSADDSAPLSQIMSATTLNLVPPCDDTGHCALR